MDFEKEYKYWSDAVEYYSDYDFELKMLKTRDEEREDCFRQYLEYTEEGLWGVMFTAANRMNDLVIGRVAQGIAYYLNKNADGQTPKVAITYDTRNYSKKFASKMADVMLGNDIEVWFFTEPTATPALGTAVRNLDLDLGLAITAGVRVGKYNGLKIFGPDGLMVDAETAAAIQEEIEPVDVFTGVQFGDVQKAQEAGTYHQILPIADQEDHVYDDYLAGIISNVKAGFETADKAAGIDPAKVDRNFPVVFTPINGTSLKPAIKVFMDSGFMKLMMVSEQAMPDGWFRTCLTPDPEAEEGMAKAIEMADKMNADLAIGIGPDSSKAGAAMRIDGEMKLLTAEELSDFFIEAGFADVGMNAVSTAIGQALDGDGIAAALAIAEAYARAKK